MPFPRLARPALGQARQRAVLPAPSQPVTEATAFDPAAAYRVKLSAPTAYLGEPLLPVHDHTVSGAVAEAIRSSIAAFEPA